MGAYDTDFEVLHRALDPIKRTADNNVHNAENHQTAVEEIGHILQTGRTSRNMSQ